MNDMDQDQNPDNVQEKQAPEAVDPLVHPASCQCAACLKLSYQQLRLMMQDPGAYPDWD